MALLLACISVILLCLWYILDLSGLNNTPLILVLIAGPFLAAGMGKMFVNAAFGFLNRFGLNKPELPLPTLFVIGLPLQLIISFIIKSTGASWLLAVLIPLAIPLLCWKDLVAMVKSIKLELTANFVFWLLIALCLGTSLFQAMDGIKTPWVNNYGDLTFHVGMITSFVFGENVPPEYHIYAGQRLTYPFMVNYWTAFLWSLKPDFVTLSLIFMYQWVICWSLIYYYLNGNKYILLPWALLLGGGTYVGLTTDKYSWELISQNVPWTVFLTTVWVTQRTACFGIALTLAALKLFLTYVDERKTGKAEAIDSRLLIAGFILSISLLAHTHTVIVFTGFIGLTLLYLSGAELLKDRIFSPRNIYQKFKPTLLFSLALIPSVLSLPWILGKSGSVKLMWGWNVEFKKTIDDFLTIDVGGLNAIFGSTPAGDPNFLQQLILTSEMWIRNIPLVIVLFFALWFLLRRHEYFFPMLFLFLFGNFVLLAAWKWDQLKFFIALYIVLLTVWSMSSSKKAFLLHFLSIGLVFFALHECGKIFLEGKLMGVYSKQDIENATCVRKYTNPEDTFLSEPSHNHLLTLAGRKMFIGYAGTLWTHGFDYNSRFEIGKNITSYSCQAGENDDFVTEDCPDYLIMTGSHGEKEFFNATDGSADTFNRTACDVMYRIKE